jgi:mRNA-degrading endonuclease RelE of RelBE toxin-antitoxin system
MMWLQIKNTTGYRLVYEVRETELLVLVVAVGQCENAEVYGVARHR